MSHFSRRNFLRLTSRLLLGLGGVLGLGGLIRFLSYKPDPPPPSRFEIGPAENYPPDSRTVLPDLPALLIHEPQGYRAISLVCPHLGCNVEVQTSGFTCPCHGSRFGAQGELLQGPAAAPLPQLRVEVTAEGGLVVYKE